MTTKQKRTECSTVDALCPNVQSMHVLGMSPNSASGT